MGEFDLSNLPIEIIHNIIDFCDLDDDDLSAIDNLMLINRHWSVAVRGHPAYSTLTVVPIDQETNVIGAICNWLLQPQRRQQVINCLIVHFDSYGTHHALRTLLDYSLNDIVFKKVSWSLDASGTFRTPSTKKLQLPRSLKASRLCVRAAGYYFDWPSIEENAYLRDNLTHLRFDGMCCDGVPSYTFLRALRKLEMKVFGGLQYKTLGLLKHHHNIKELHVEDIIYVARDKMPLGDLSHIEVLTLYGVVTDFQTTTPSSLKELHMGTDTLINLMNVPDSLEVLTLNSCWDDDPPSDLSAYEFELPVHPSALFPEFPNLKVLKVHNCKSKSLSDIFNAGYLKKSMPALEELRLYDTSISATALFDFIRTHSKLKVVSVPVHSNECPTKATEMTLDKAMIGTIREHDAEFPVPRTKWY